LTFYGFVIIETIKIRKSYRTYSNEPIEPEKISELRQSASNKQPWRIIKDRDQNSFHFYLKRTPGYENIVKNIKLQNVDMGIAMCHFDLSAKELGLKGDWNVNSPQIKSDDMEYIVSWIAHDQA
jgi:hypothetical protein